MSSEWSETTLGGFVRLQRGHDLTASEQQPGPYPVMGSAGQNGSHNVAKAKGPGVVVGRSGASMGRVHYSESDYWPHNTCLYVTDFQGNNPRFAYYVLGSLDLAGYNSGSAQPSLNRNYIYGMPLKIPSRAQQDSIVEVLSALDDRIALLRETNATLEAIAQALFKSWFVDFDPVHARALGEEPAGLSPEVAALFPASFEESELGIVPKGWRVGTLADLSDLNPESWTSRTHPESVRYVDLANTKDNVIAEVTEFSFEEAPSRARRVLRDGDTIVGTVRPGNRSFAFISNASANLTGSTGFAVLRPRHDRNTEFVFLAATSDNSIDHLAHVADGGAYPAVRSEVVSGLSCVVPDGDVLCAFHEVAQPIFNKVAANHQQAQTLATLRDTLLPRLISGQLRLPEAESLVEATL
ncbi:restriction endonuclease subunit S [Aeromonas media]|uniref:restriction endonuclease subunit S n=1 Tax=Aeromonas media TaxID=651 RepID=UPI003D05EF1B